MATQYSQANHPPSTNKLLLLLILIAMAVAFTLAVGQLELTRHAAQGRENTSLDAATISKMIDAKACSPIESYECPELFQQKIICKITGKGDIWAGLIIGTATDPPVIITGYPAPYKYWMGTVVRDRCYMTGANF